MLRSPRRAPLARFFYRCRYRLGEYTLKGFMAVMPRVPYRWTALFTSFMARLTFVVVVKYRRRMEQNLVRSLGAQVVDPAQRKQMVWRAWNNFAQGLLDTIAVVFLSREQITATVDVEGEEHLREALARKKGVIALSAHLGAFTMIGPRLAAAGYPFSAVIKDPPDPRLAQLMTEYRARVGVHTIAAKPRQEAVRGILRALRKNGIVLVIADEFKSGGVEMTFMGQHVAVPRGPASLALRTGAATVPIFAPRHPDGSVRLQIGPEIEPVRGDDVESSVAETTKLFTSHIERAIRQFPEQWSWMGFARSERKSRTEYLREARLRRRLQARKAAARAQSASNIVRR